MDETPKYDFDAGKIKPKPKIIKITEDVFVECSAPTMEDLVSFQQIGDWQEALNIVHKLMPKLKDHPEIQLTPNQVFGIVAYIQGTVIDKETLSKATQAQTPEKKTDSAEQSPVS